MPNVLHTMHTWSGYSNVSSVMLHKRSIDGSGVVVMLMIVVAIVAAVIAVAFFFRWVKGLQAKQYKRSGGRARWSRHRPLAQRTFRTERPVGTAADPELGLEMPQRPPPSYHTRSLRSQANRKDRPRPSQTIGQYLQSQAQIARSGSNEGRRGGAPTAQEYYGSEARA